MVLEEAFEAFTSRGVYIGSSVAVLKLDKLEGRGMGTQPRPVLTTRLYQIHFFFPVVLVVRIKHQPCRGQHFDLGHATHTF